MTRWLLLLAIPLAGLVLLLVEPETDVHWEHHPAHFWLVLLTALVSVVLGYLAGEAARRLGDARLFLVSLAFVTSAGFLGLHALATPGVLLESMISRGGDPPIGARPSSAAGRMYIARMTAR